MSISIATGNSRANDLSSAQLSSLPSWAIESFDRAGLNAKYAFSTRVNPFYQRADFDGDGKMDLAILVSERATGKVGIAFIMRSRPTWWVVGAGNPVGDHGDDFTWVDAWSVYERGPVEQGAGDGRPPKLKGEALLVEKTEAASALLWWDGKGISWYQQGD